MWCFYSSWIVILGVLILKIDVVIENLTQVCALLWIMILAWFGRPLSVSSGCRCLKKVSPRIFKPQQFGFKVFSFHSKFIGRMNCVVNWHIHRTINAYPTEVRKFSAWFSFINIAYLHANLGTKQCGMSQHTPLYCQHFHLLIILFMI